MRNSKLINFYRKSQYGVEREFVHPSSDGDAQILLRLTGKRTIDSVTRELVRDLTGGMVSFQEVLAPSTLTPPAAV